jgi:dihydroneopterin aldolase
MDQRVKLLEHLGYGIIQDIRAAYPEVRQLRITLKKQQPAIGGLVDFSGVTLFYPEDFS